MADLTSAGTGGAGLGLPAARWVLTAVWALGLVSEVLGGVVAPPFGPEVPALALGLVGALVLTTRGDDRLSSRRALLVAAATVASGTAALAADAPLGHTWSFNFAAYTAALLIPRGNVAVGVVAGGLLGAVGLGRALAAEASPGQLVDLLALPLLAVVIGSAWRWALHRIVTRELAHEREAGRAAVMAAVSEAATAAARRELAEIAAEVAPVLGGLRDGVVLDEERVRGIGVVEAEVRDRIRSPAARHPRLVAAVSRARRRGVSVVLLGGAAGVVGDDLAGAVARLVDDVPDGALTVRLVPPGRDGALSVLVERPGRSERVLFDAAGGVIARR